MTGYPIILGGDHAAFEQEWAASGRPDNERPDWPLPSFDATDWASAFCKIANEDLGYRDPEGKPIDEGWMITWFANALMRGFDEHSARAALPHLQAQPDAQRISFPRWWVQQAYTSLNRINTRDIPGQPGDTIFTLRHMLLDALELQPPVAPPVADYCQPEAK